MDRRTLLIAAAGWGLAAPLARAQAPGPAYSRAALYSAERAGAAFLVARHGVILFEHYPPGSAREARWPIGRGARVLALLLAASLADDGLLRLDELVADTLTEWQGQGLKQFITMRTLLQGVSGLAFEADAPQDAAHALALEPQREPGVHYSDDAAPFVLLAEFARRKLVAASRPPDPAIYLQTRTLDPIGCGPVQWLRGPDGAALFDNGASLSARAWAQVGELIRREGVWRAQEIVDAAVLREAQHGSLAEPRVGMGLWLAAPGSRGARAPGTDSDIWRMTRLPPDLIMAAGAGGQRLFVIPSLNLVVARLSRSDAGDDWSDASFLSLVLREA